MRYELVVMADHLHLGGSQGGRKTAGEGLSGDNASFR